ncbi:hypothetical protein [Kitasatospora phosalacinea]|uniref:Uncharacterized protein n=1 Tax=Kitasatospora phosalacinea TaxID=2065 RepID=A0A9W6PNZ8_9ACTN|nr:hypothetical protein [Kitasatospora phosalacinea]GLW58547.1 hypothetical protein Kpho01_65580 [Kitasatospora phosalacinea]
MTPHHLNQAPADPVQRAYRALLDHALPRVPAADTLAATVSAPLAELEAASARN